MLKKPLITLLVAFSLLFYQGIPVHAQFAEIPQELRQTAGVDDCKSDQVSTALGCISTTPEGFVESILGFVVGISGATALLLLLYGFFLLSTSSGNPDQVRNGKEIVMSAIAGLIFTAMSVTLMGFIGINILGIPGLQ